MLAFCLDKRQYGSAKSFANLSGTFARAKKSLREHSCRCLWYAPDSFQPAATLSLPALVGPKPHARILSWRLASCGMSAVADYSTRCKGKLSIFDTCEADLLTPCVKSRACLSTVHGNKQWAKGGRRDEIRARQNPTFSTALRVETAKQHSSTINSTTTCCTICANPSPRLLHYPVAGASSSRMNIVQLPTGNAADFTFR